MAGITNKVSIKENMIPPIITIPNETRLVEPVPKAIAMGTAPSAIAKLVIKIGRKRMAAAYVAAYAVLIPSFRL